jgi:hypothetical protein
MQRIEFYFGPISPFAYLGSVQIERLAARLRPRAVRYTELAPGRLKNLWRCFDDGYNFSAAAMTLYPAASTRRSSKLSQNWKGPDE